MIQFFLLQKGVFMGTWGSGLYSNDSTTDVKEIYMQFLQQQFSNEEAYEKTK